jgi:mannan endo-1,4-beta-mannosidase
MKGLITAYLLLATSAILHAQNTLHTNGRYLFTASNDTVILRGINYPLIDDGSIDFTDSAVYKHKIDEAAKTGANAIRLPWFTDGTHWRDVQTANTLKGYLTNGVLDRILRYCHAKKMIPVLELHDATCTGDWTFFNNNIAPWWKRSDVVAMINRHKEYLVINPANEFGTVRWSGDAVAELATYKTNYNTFISQMRTAGVNVPIMIDAPDCAQSSTELLGIAQSMLQADTKHNLIFSGHAYWSSYASTQSAIDAKLGEAVTANVCFVLGEVANTQDGNSCGDISLASIYPKILASACSRKIGWLAWTYHQDCDANRSMTTNGEFNTLNTYGDDIVNNTSYGLKSTGGCGARLSDISTAIEDIDVAVSYISVYPNPVNSIVTIKAGKEGTIYITDIAGKSIWTLTIAAGEHQLDMAQLNPGVYFLKADYGVTRRIIKQ